MAKRGVVWSVESSEFRRVFDNSTSIKQALMSLGLRNTGGSYETFKARCEAEGIDLAEIEKRRSEENARRLAVHRGVVETAPLSSLLVVGGRYNRSHLKARLVAEGVLDSSRCSVCGMGDVWNGHPIVMVLDHINGVRDDNRLDNLRLVCPNCNSQLPTFSRGSRFKTDVQQRMCSAGCGRRITRKSKGGMCLPCTRRAESLADPKRNWVVKERPSPDELADLMGSLSLAAIGRMYGVSGNAVRKWSRAHR